MLGWGTVSCVILWTQFIGSYRNFYGDEVRMKSKLHHFKLPAGNEFYTRPFNNKEFVVIICLYFYIRFFLSHIDFSNDLFFWLFICKAIWRVYMLLSHCDVCMIDWCLNPVPQFGFILKGYSGPWCSIAYKGHFKSFFCLFGLFVCPPISSVWIDISFNYLHHIYINNLSRLFQIWLTSFFVEKPYPLYMLFMIIRVSTQY